MHKNTFVTVLLMALMAFSGAEAAAKAAPAPAKAPATTKAAVAPRPTASGTPPPANAPAPAAPKVVTGAVAAAGGFDFYYLNYNVSYPIGGTVSFWMMGQDDPNGTPPTKATLSLYDEFGKVKLVDIATDLAVPTTQGPFIWTTWQVPATLPANFDFDDTFTAIVTYQQNSKTTNQPLAQPSMRDRRLTLTAVKATPGGGINPAMAQNSTVIPVVVSGPNGTTTLAPGVSGTVNSQSTGTTSDASSLWQVSKTALCAFAVMQVVLAWVL